MCLTPSARAVHHTNVVVYCPLKHMEGAPVLFLSHLRPLELLTVSDETASLSDLPEDILSHIVS